MTWAQLAYEIAKASFVGTINIEDEVVAYYIDREGIPSSGLDVNFREDHLIVKRP